jgi:two-component system LytT family response regulator
MNHPASQRIRCLIVDDEELPRQLLREFLAACPDVEVIGECANGFDAVIAARPDDARCADAEAGWL